MKWERLLRGNTTLFFLPTVTVGPSESVSSKWNYLLFLWNLWHSLPCFQWLLETSTSSGPTSWTSRSQRDIRDQFLSPPKDLINQKRSTLKSTTCFLYEVWSNCIPISYLPVAIFILVSYRNPWAMRFQVFHITNYLIFVKVYGNYFVLLEQFVCHHLFLNSTLKFFL